MLNSREAGGLKSPISLLSRFPVGGWRHRICDGDRRRFVQGWRVGVTHSCQSLVFTGFRGLLLGGAAATRRPGQALRHAQRCCCQLGGWRHRIAPPPLLLEGWRHRTGRRAVRSRSLLEHAQLWACVFMPTRHASLHIRYCICNKVCLLREAFPPGGLKSPNLSLFRGNAAPRPRVIRITLRLIHKSCA